MAIDGLFVKHLTKELNNELSGGKITKVTLISPLELLVHVRAKNKTQKLIISCSTNYARIHITKNYYQAPSTPYNLTITFRKHLLGAVILSISQVENDRVIKIEVSKYNELGDLLTKILYVEIMGKHSNIILVEGENVVDAVKRITPFMSRYRTVLPNAKYFLPPNNKLNPYKKKVDFSNLTNYQGLSRQSIDEINYTNSLDIIYQPQIKPTIYTSGKKSNFYFCELHVDAEKKYFNTLSEMLDAFYFNKDKFDRNKQQNNDLNIFIKAKINKLTNKTEKLQVELNNAKDYEKYLLYGELLLNNKDHISKGMHEIEVLDYYNNKKIIIALDPRKTAIENSNKYYLKAKKTRTSIKYLSEQIKISQSENKYFKSIQEQLSFASLEDTKEIHDELVKNKYLKAPKKKERLSKKPNYLVYKLSNDTIYVGKNNIQNSYLTHHLAKNDDYWFHVKNASGSHVILKTSLLNEQNIRQAANLAALYSTYASSSSVAVDYTQKKYVKKIPGEKDCFVAYSNQKTIYIDPDIRLVNDLKKVK